MAKATFEERRALFDRLIMGGWMAGYFHHDEGDSFTEQLEFTTHGQDRLAALRDRLMGLKLKDWTDAEWNAFREMILEEQYEHFGTCD